jgi:glycosyltransferase involved in cell wall biosynthesis
MSRSGEIGSYILVTPVKDEERYIAETLTSVTQQTIRPLCWVVVDDGSTDRTPEIIAPYVKRFDWIRYVRVDREAKHILGLAEVRAFAAGYETMKHLAHEYVVKLDADLRLPVDYFEQMLLRMDAKPTLGIASGVYLEEQATGWVPIQLPKYHAAGAAKMVRLSCYEAIGGFPLFPGWDTADEIKAWTKGWETTHFPDLHFYHLKPEGSELGTGKTSYKHGAIYYVCGGGPGFFAAKVLDRLVKGKPPVVAGVMLLLGYLNAVISRTPRLVSPLEASYYRQRLNRRVTDRLSLRLSSRVCPIESRTNPELEQHQAGTIESTTTRKPGCA